MFEGKLKQEGGICKTVKEKRLEKTNRKVKISKELVIENWWPKKKSIYFMKSYEKAIISHIQEVTVLCIAVV